MMLRLPANHSAASTSADAKESRMNKLIKATLALAMLGGMAFPIIVMFFAWQRGLGSTH